MKTLPTSSPPCGTAPPSYTASARLDSDGRGRVRWTEASGGSSSSCDADDDDNDDDDDDDDGATGDIVVCGGACRMPHADFDVVVFPSLFSAAVP